MSTLTPLLCLLLVHINQVDAAFEQLNDKRRSAYLLTRRIQSNPNRLAFLSRIGREEFYNGLFVFGIPQITDMSAVWKERHLVAQRFFERFDGFSLGQEIIDVVQDVHLGIATQPIHDVC